MFVLCDQILSYSLRWIKLTAHEVTLLWFSLFVTPWTTAHQAPHSWDFPGKNTRVGCISFFRGPSRPRDQIHVSCVSCMGRQILYHWVTREAQVTLQSAYLLIQNGLCLFPITGPFISAIQRIFSDIKPERKLMVIRFLLYTGHASHIYTCYF